jgi:YesN/AraC family two-component response regulator
MIDVLIVDDQTTVKEILKSYIEPDLGLNLIGCASNGKEAIELVKTCQPHIVLMDIEMPEMDGLTATRIITEKFIKTSVLIISVHNDDSYLNSALQVGAKGYLKKNTPEKELINAIYSAYKGYFQLGPGFLEQYLRKTSESQFNSQEIEQLKSVILQQSKLLDNLNGKTSRYRRTKNDSRNVASGSKTSLENRCDALEKQIYHISHHLNKLERKINLLKPLVALAILCCAFLALAVLLSFLI